MSVIKRRRSKRLNERIDSKKRSSFDERVCDDLCEVLLQYLPFEDKFRLECVSKQFQRNVFNRQFELVLDHTLYHRLHKKGGRRMIAFIGTAFETILKKCLNIKTIDLMFFYYSSYRKTFGLKYNKIIDIIIENCDHLKEFELYVNQMTPKTIDNFCQKFATKLSSIRFIHSDKLFDKQLLTSLSNITDLSLIIRGLDLGFDDNYYRLSNVFDDNNQCLVRNLRRLSLKYGGNEVNLLMTLIESNPHLKIVDLLCHNTDQLSLCQLLSRFPLLSDLTQLNLTIDIFLRDSSFAESLILLAKKCPNLKKIRMPLIHFEDNDNSRQLVLEIIDSLKHFKNLKYIDLWVDCLFETNVRTFFTAKQFRVCKELTHLSLYYNEVNDSFFKDIGALLPGLRSLYIMNANITKSTLEELAQLKNIQELHLHQELHFGQRVTKGSAAQMYIKCPKLKNIIIT